MRADWNWNQEKCRYECGNGDVLEDQRNGLGGKLEYRRGSDVYVFEYELGSRGYCISAQRGVHQVRHVPKEEALPLLQELQNATAGRVEISLEGVSLNTALTRARKRREATNSQVSATDSDAQRSPDSE
jgi:hypothetical protein